MIVYSQTQIDALCENNLHAAIRKLSELQVYCGNEPMISGLNGWVYEQTIQYCLKKELKAKSIRSPISEQATLGKRIKADLKIGSVAIEIKWFGLFGKDDAAKYKRYQQAAKKLGLDYLYLTGNEGYQSYRDGIITKLGRDNAFFLDTPREWGRFVKRVAYLLKRQ